MTCFSLHFDELKLAPMMGFGWTQLQAGGKAHLTVLLAFMGEPWSRSNTGG